MAVVAAGSLLWGCDSEETGGPGGGTTVTAGGTGGTAGSGASAAGGGTGGAGASGAAGGTGGIGGGAVGCDPLPAPTGNVVNVDDTQADDLPNIVQSATTGTTIVLAPGNYTMTAGSEGGRRMQFRTPGVTLRGATDDASDVTIDGEYVTLEMITIHANDVTIANLTLTHAVDHPIHVTGGDSETITGTRLYNLRIFDSGEQFVKVNANGSYYADDGELACSYFELTDAGRPHIEPNPGGCYTGGIDAHYAWGWVVRDNVFLDIYCDGSGLAEHAVHFWSASRDTLVERNLIYNCARGIGFGLVEDGNTRDYQPDPYPGVGYIGHYDGIIRNNVIAADHQWFDTGIELDQARGALCIHNTIVQPGTAYSSIDYRFANTDVTIRNNIVRNITQRNGAQGTVDTNLETTETAIFEDVAGWNFHLAAGSNAAVDTAAVEAEAGTDIDGETHDNGAPDMGADERW